MQIVVRVLAVVILALSPLAVPSPASAAPVKCAAGDLTPDGRVFPEPMVSLGFVKFTEFECGMKLLEKTYPNLLQITTVGTSKGGHPVYDVLLTDETVTAPKQKLLIVNSIHGNEPGGREGGLRVLEDLVDPQFEASKPYVQQALDRFVVHFLFPNPDGWVAGDVEPGVFSTASRGNDNGRDLNRQFPVKGWINTSNAPLAEPETKALMPLLSKGGWYLGTDNHGQGADTYGAAGLQIVGQFDFQKSETLARYADAISAAFAEVDVLSTLQAIGASSGQDAGAYHWGTLYDMLGYSASGSMIDFYNTFDGLNGTGYATEVTAGQHVNTATYGGLLTQMWVDSMRAINFTMLKQALVQKRYTFPIGGDVGYVYDPAVVRSSDGTGAKTSADEQETPYAVSRMRFFTDLDTYASRRLTPVNVADVLSGKVPLDRFDSLVLADNPKPGPGTASTWYAKLRTWVEKGGNLVVTDAAAPAIPRIGAVPNSDNLVRSDKKYVGYVDFTDRTHPLAKGLRGVARQTYDSVPIGYAFPPAGENCPNWTIDQAAWEKAGGKTVATNGTGRTAYGELALGKGKVRFLGALLPQPTEEFFHPYGLQNYAVTYTGYTLLQNMLAYDAAGLGGGAAGGSASAPGGARSAPSGALPSTGGFPEVAALGALLIGLSLVRRRVGAARRTR
ncbi:MAG: hypothetical protein JJD92_11515 [Frankiaceae bacterium]|nr:hypothetical protein [Frankiaceae bacterium]